MIYDSFISNTRFSDLEHFPLGILNIRDFTQMETDVLLRCGFKMKQLFDGDLEPENEDQKRFLAVVRGFKKPLYHIDYVFLKYLSLIQKKGKITA
ncbi:MAG: DUF413 domain-containing protein [Gammaproteobacteria bacterium]|nr:DUF413 domain-containing protein [Gammaproteobacteria bacterium]